MKNDNCFQASLLIYLSLQSQNKCMHSCQNFVFIFGIFKDILFKELLDYFFLNKYILLFISIILKNVKGLFKIKLILAEFSKELL